jgi:hypothetical protein
MFVIGNDQKRSGPSRAVANRVINVGHQLFAKSYHMGWMLIVRQGYVSEIAWLDKRVGRQISGFRVGQEFVEKSKTT